MRYCWKSDKYGSTETCSVIRATNGFHIVSRIELHDGFSVNYELTVDKNWNTERFLVSSRIGNNVFAVDGERATSGRWTIDGREAPEFDNCTDIDITLTPLTNSVPVKRLHLSVIEQRQIEVIYIDIEERKVSRKKQQYTRKATDTYHFETVPNDFEADILFGEDDFVEKYPELFERIVCGSGVKR
jgi:uncharacterized protein